MDKEDRIRFNRAQSESFDGLYDRFLVDLAADVVERMGRIVAAGAIAPGETVLDVGTGTGVLLPQIHACEPGRVVVCDLSEKMLEQVAHRHPQVERHHCDICDLDLPADSLNVVFMNGMFGNIADKPRALRNVARMLRPGGRAVISHPEGRAYVEQIVRSDPFPIPPLPSEEEAQALFEACGMHLRQYTDEERLLIVVASAE